MGAIDWAIDMGQSADICRLKEVCEKQQEEINALKDNVEMLSKWIIFFIGNRYEYGTMESRSFDEEGKEGCTQGTGEARTSSQDSSQNG